MLILLHGVFSFSTRLHVSARLLSPGKGSPRIPVFDVKLFLDSAGLGRKIDKFRTKRNHLLAGRSREIPSCTFGKAV